MAIYYIQCVCNHSTALVVIFFLVAIFHFATFMAHPKFYRQFRHYAFKNYGTVVEVRVCIIIIDTAL
jgi:hypothetical protein